MGDPVTIVEVGPRDGWQGIAPFIPTATKIDFLMRLAGAGLRRIEIGSFVSARALPQLADTPALLAACTERAALAGIDPQVLVPSERRGRDALGAGSRHLSYVLSVSAAHNSANVRRSPGESADDYARLVAAMPHGTAMRLNLSTAFDCPFEGRIAQDATLALLGRLVPILREAEICLCDTTGRADPAGVAALFAAARDRFGTVGGWSYHGHDTYGLGLANVHAAYAQGVRVFDASFAGLGGCPFAPGATGNVATEDLAWMFSRMGVATGIDLDALIPIAVDGAALPGSLPGGRVRAALRASGGGCPAPGT